MNRAIRTLLFVEAASFGGGRTSLCVGGDLIGGFVIIIGIGPRTVPDVVYHVAIVAVLIHGLMVASRVPPHDAGRRA